MTDAHSDDGPCMAALLAGALPAQVYDGLVNGDPEGNLLHELAAS